MRVCIHKDVIGSDRHLVSDGDEFCWSPFVPDDAWLCGFSDSHLRSVDLLASQVGVSLKVSPSESHDKSWSILRPNGSVGVPWRWVLRGSTFQAHLEQLLDQIWELLRSNHDSYYGQEFVTMRGFLQSLDRSKIDKKGLYEILDNPGERDGSLRSFIPDSQGLLNKISYSQTSSCSGRLTVKSGPSILTMRKDRRSLLRSRYTDGKIIQIDFVSLEPRVALCTAGSPFDGDIYDLIRRDVLNSEVDRKSAKIATIGCLYGMSAKKLSEVLGSNDSSRQILKKIRNHFKIPKLEKDLKSQLSENGSITNLYGRVMTPDSDSGHLLVNRFIQSTAADAAILGFSSLCDQISNEEIRARPIFVIHDALIFDVDCDDLVRINDIIENPLILPKLDGKFPVSMEIIS